MRDAIERWFFDWMNYHQRLHPSRQWVPTSDGEATDFYEGWIDEFVRIRAEEDLAREASKRLQAENPGHPSRHLEAVARKIGDLRRSHKAAVAADVRPPVVPPDVVAECRGCPECLGDGWARRWVKLRCFDRPFLVDMFCRCKAGRWRKANDVELIRGDRERRHEDLQARPDLWHPELKSRLWTDREAVHDLFMGDFDGGFYEYLPADAVVESAARPRDMVRSAAGPKLREAS